MAENYVLLERIELNDSAASVTFSNIPQSGYTDLKVVISGRSTRSNLEDYLKVSFNSDTTTGNYTGRYLYGTGSGVGSETFTSGGVERFVGNSVGATATANTFSNVEVYIPNYRESSVKSYSVDSVNENNATAAASQLIAGLWSGTSSISSIAISTAFGSFVQYSTFSLYGLAAVGTTPTIAPKAVGGNITTDGTYWYHTFQASNTFVPNTNLSVDYLVVAGGGGGGRNCGGAGGAGGLRSTVTATGGGGSLESALSLTNGTTYTVTVGAGGAGSVNDTSESANGSDSVFATITSIGGGGTKPYNSTEEGKSGGSGGGSNGDNNGTQGNGASGGAGTTGQGYAGGRGWQNGPGAYNQRGGGGGGAGAVGVTANNTTTPHGGDGVAVSISGSSVTYAGGGGGAGFNYTAGTGGAGGGGTGNTGGNNANASSATAYTGGGGGGAMYGAPGNGGSGIVIVRYPV